MEEFSVLADTYRNGTKVREILEQLISSARVETKIPFCSLIMLCTSFSAAGIFFCFLEKENAPDLIGDTDVDAQRSPKI